MADRNGGTARVAITLTFITIVCKILGFVKNSVLAYYFGTSQVVDAYVMTFSIGMITCGWIAGLVGNFTPVFKKIESESGRKNALVFAGNVHNFILFLVIVLIVVLEIVAPVVVKIVAPGFDDVTFDYTVWFFRIYLISVLFYASYRFANEFLNCNQKHLWASVPDVLMSGCNIIAIIISIFIGNYFLIFGYVIAVVLQSILEQIFSYKIGFRHRLRIKWDENLKAMIIMAIPIFLSNTLAEINTLIDKIFASNLKSGIVASMDYANTMKEFAFQLGTIALVTMIFPVLSRLWAEGDVEGFKKKVLKGINYMTVLYVPMIAGIIATGDIVINIVFKRGQFTDDAAVVTTNAFIIYSIALIALALRSVFFKAFYSMQKTKYILLVSIVNVAFNVILNILLVGHLGYIGLAMATCLAAMVTLPIYFWLFRRSLGRGGFSGFAGNLIKTVVASVIMLMALVIYRKMFFPNAIEYFGQQIFVLFSMVTIGVIVYAVIGRMIKITEIDEFIKLVKDRLSMTKTGR